MCVLKASKTFDLAGTSPPNQNLLLRDLPACGRQVCLCGEPGFNPLNLHHQLIKFFHGYRGQRGE